MSTTTAHTQPLIEDSLLTPPPIPHSSRSFPTKHSGLSTKHLPSFHAFTDALRHSSTKLDDMLEELDLSKDETNALLASHKFAAHRQLRTHLLSQQLTIAAQDHAQHALQTLLKLLDSNHAAIARLACTQLLAYAHLTPTPPTPNDPHPLIAPSPSAPTTPSTTASPTPPVIIHNAEFSISPPPPPPPAPSQPSPGIAIPAAPPTRLSTVVTSATTTIALSFVLCVLSFAFPTKPPAQLTSALPPYPIPYTLDPSPPSPLCFPVRNPILPILPGSSLTHLEPSSSGTEKGTLVSIYPPAGQDGQPTPAITPLSLSRRHFVGLLGLTSAALITGCQDFNTAKPAAAVTPLAPARPAQKPLAAADEYAPPVPIKPLAPPVTTVAPKNTYGILPRSMWARGGPDLARVEPMNGVNLITFHHSGDPVPFWATDFGETAQHLEGVRDYHRSRYFNDIGYHFAIDRVGRVWQLRSLKYEGQHVRYNNEHNIGVVVLGNFQLQTMTQAQKDKVRIFGLLLRKEYGLPISRIKTHQEIVSTECPGIHMQGYMKAIRQQRLI